MVTALMVKPGEHPCPTQLCDNRDYLDRAVSADMEVVCSAAVMRLTDGIAIIYNDEALMMGTANRRVGERIFSGVFYVVGLADGRLVSLTDAQIAQYMVRFWETEIYTTDEVVDAWIDSLCAAMEMA